jgi:hypothetical protein
VEPHPRITVHEGGFVTSPEAAQFWFDPICPWTWGISRWMRAVETVRPVTTEWRLMSLAYLNLVQRKEIGPSAELRNPIALQYLEERGYGPIRICAAAARAGGDEIIGPFYEALGARMHDSRRRGDPAIFVEALAAVGLPESLADAATTEEFDEVIKKSHHEAFDQVGLDVGAPVIQVRGNAFYGPVVIPPPMGEAAGLLWDAFVVVATTEGFYEIKRSRDIGPPFD